MSRYIDGEYQQANATWHAEDSPWKARHILKILERNNVLNGSSTVCEIGCGAGEILAQLLEQTPPSVKFVGYDISPQAYELAMTRQQGDRLTFQLADLLSSDDDTHFDVVLCVDVFEHVENPHEFLRNLRKFAKYFVFHIPLDLSVQSALRRGRLLKDWKDVGHLNFYNRELALHLLEETGYRVVDHQFTSSAISLQTYTPLRAAARLPRRIAFKLWPDAAARILGGFSLLVLARGE